MYPKVYFPLFMTRASLLLMLSWVFFCSRHRNKKEKCQSTSKLAKIKLKMEELRTEVGQRGKKKHTVFFAATMIEDSKLYSPTERPKTLIQKNIYRAPKGLA